MDVKTVEKGVIRAWLKMTAFVMLLYGIIIGVFYGWNKWSNHKREKQAIKKEYFNEEAE